MKKAIICTFALSLFALPMSLHATPPAKDSASKTKVIKPLSALKSTMASPSKSPADSTKVAEGSEKALAEKADAVKKMAEDTGKAGAKKAAGN